MPKPIKEIIQVEFGGVTLTEEQYLDSPDFQALIDFVTGQAPEYLPSPKRQTEIILRVGFRPEYMKQLFDHMASGKSYQSYGSRIGLTENRRKKWEREIFEWNYVRELGQVAALERMEEKGFDLMDGNVQYGQGAVYIAYMKAHYDKWNPEQKKVSFSQHQILPADGKAALQLKVIAGPELLQDDEIAEES